MIQNLVQESIKEYFEPYVDHTLRNPVLFGDFRNALTHNTDQRYYEDLLDFEAVFFLFQEVNKYTNSNFFTPLQIELKCSQAVYPNQLQLFNIGIQ